MQTTRVDNRLLPQETERNTWPRWEEKRFHDTDLPGFTVLVKVQLHQIGPFNSTIRGEVNQHIFVVILWSPSAAEAEVELDVLRVPQVQVCGDQVSVTVLQ